MIIGTSLCPNCLKSANYKEKLIKIKKAGFDAVDLDMSDDGYTRVDFFQGRLYPEKNIFLKSVDEIIEYFKQYTDAIKEAGLEISQAHAPFPAGVSDRPNTIEHGLKTMEGCVKFCIAMGIKNLVIHGHSLFDWDNAHSPEDIKKLNDDLYTSLIPIVKGTNLVICLEDMFVPYKGTNIRGHCTFPIETAREIDYYNSLCDGEEHFGYCLDIGHMNLIHQDIEKFIKTLGNRIKCTHIHDNYGYLKDMHIMPFFGRMDYSPMLEGFKAIGYDGDICFETWAYEGKPAPISNALLEFLGATGKYFVNAIKGKSKIWY